MDHSIRRETLWPTPIVTLRLEGCEALNEGLARIIRDQENEILAKEKPVAVAGQYARSLTAHWLQYNVLNWDFPEVALFREQLLVGVREFIEHSGGDPADPAYRIKGISVWANILRHGDALALHHHDPGFCSFHYHVTSGHPDDVDRSSQPFGMAESGNTVYLRAGFSERSHGGKQAGSTSPWDEDWRLSLPALPGKLLLFPSFVRHEVRPHFGSQERISIAGDVYIARQESLISFGGKRWYVPPWPHSQRERI